MIPAGTSGEKSFTHTYIYTKKAQVQQGLRFFISVIDLFETAGFHQFLGVNFRDFGTN